MNEGLLDRLALDRVLDAEQVLRAAVTDELAEVARRIEAGAALDGAERARLLEIARAALQSHNLIPTANGTDAHA